MDDKLRNYYLESQVNNAAPGQMLVMLYDELLTQAETVDAEITELGEKKELNAAAKAVSRCINILTELNTCLNHSVDPKLCGRLSDLYLFFTKQISDALTERRPAKVREILPLLRRLRDAWCEADRRANPFRAGAVAVAA